MTIFTGGRFTWFSGVLMLALCSLALAVAAAPSAPTKSEAEIQKKLESALKTPIKAVQATPYSGLYEVQIGGDLIYVDKDAKYIFSGNIIEIQNKSNLTENRREALAQIVFDDLPLQNAIKSVNGKGTRRVAVFEDPNCGYCKRFRKVLTQTDDLTIYTFPFNILAESSAEISKAIWCSANPSLAWDNWMLKGEMPKAEASDKTKAADKTAKKCDFPNDDILALGRKLGISGTPATYFANGKRVSGAVSEADFKQALVANAK